MIHIIEEVNGIFRMLGEAHRLAKPGAMATVVMPHYPRPRLLLQSGAPLAPLELLVLAFSLRPREYDYYAPAIFPERRVHVELLRIWRGLGFEFLVNRFRRFRKFWEYPTSFVTRGKTVE